MVSNQGETYSRFIEHQLAAEHARRLSLDDRSSKLAQAVILIAGLFATAAGLMASELSTAGNLSAWLFGATCTSLMTAFVGATVSGHLKPYEVADLKTMGAMLNEHWVDTEPSSRNITAHLNAQAAASLREGNNFKASALTWASVPLGLSVPLGTLALLAALLTEA